MRILALDLGTKTGVTHNLNEGVIHAETITLASPKQIALWGKNRMVRRSDPRIQSLFQFLINLPPADIVVFEDVEFTTYTKQSQLWSAFRTTVWLAFDGKSLLECVPVTTLKKFAAGFGNADKTAMRTSLIRKHPDFEKLVHHLDDNAIDSIWIYLWAQQHLARMPVCRYE